MPAANDLAALKIDRNSKRRRIPLWPFVLGGLVLLAVVGLPALQNSMQGIEVRTAPVVKVLTLKQLEGAKSAAETELAAAGYVIADRQAVLAAKFVARMAKLNVKEAQEVKKGDTIAELEHQELDAQIAQIKAEIAEQKAEAARLRTAVAQSEAEIAAARVPIQTLEAEIAVLKVQWADANRRLERDKKLAEAEAMGFSEVDDRLTEVRMAEARMQMLQRRKAEFDALAAVREKQTDAARAAVKVAEARVAVNESRVGVLEAQLQEYFIHAPFDGVVTEKAAEQGEIIAPVSVGGQMARGSIVTVADWASLQAEVDVAETYIGRVRPGQRAAISVDAMPGRSFAGKVQRVLPRANRSKATVQVRVEFLPDKDGKSVFAAERILPDMGIRVKFLPDDAPAGAETGEAKPVHCAPKDAVIGEGAAAYAWVVKDNLATRRPLKLGARSDQWIEVLEGLEPGEQVVIEGASKLAQDGAKVKVLEK